MKSLFLSIIIAVLLAAACTRVPDGVEPVQEFQLARYLGRWHEIARLDHPFERGLEQVSATYTLREDGGVRVLNRGYDPKHDRWDEAEGKAWFVSDPGTGHLKVSFFGPFYGAYVVFELDREAYQYAFVAGPNRSYLWLLARTPHVDQDLIDRFVRRAGELGFPTGELIFTRQE